ncbi:NUDIX domain-containing protein [Candidatus Pacearchaeota archaeon]|nr:NUDIX domain-containing protein [Candidatus Pacearchaeota archaeon]MBD3283516.1 NUDIX domain-containing protein [Candidatus Pacearchaeota archaeon]
MVNKKNIEVREKRNNIFVVNLLGIVFDIRKKKILIVRRKKDPYIKNLFWAFPGGQLSYDGDLEKVLEKKIKKKTGLKVKNLGAVFSRIAKESQNLLLIYYLCEVVGGKEKKGEDILEIKWVNPEELEDYFTTSFDKRLREYIMNLK